MVTFITIMMVFILVIMLVIYKQFLDVLFRLGMDFNEFMVVMNTGRMVDWHRTLRYGLYGDVQILFGRYVNLTNYFSELKDSQYIDNKDIKVIKDEIEKLKKQRSHRLYGDMV